MKLYPNITLIFIIWLISVFSMAFISFSTFPNSGKFNNDFIKSFSNWDGGHFLGIAQFGYSEKYQYAFFPLYPLVIRGVSQITENYLISGILVSIFSTFFGLHLLFGIIKEDFDKKIAEKVILFLLFFPASFYFLTVYSEGLFFLLSVSFFYFLRKNKLFWATILTMLLSVTRLVGLSLAFILIIDVQTRAGINKKNWWILLSPLGFILYCFFLNSQTGDPFYFITAESHWQRILTVPGVGFWETLKNIAIPGFITSNFNIFLDLLFAILGAGFAIRTFRFLPISYSLYSLISVIIPLFTPTLSSIPRFLLVIFPLFILLAQVKNYYIQLFYQIFSTMLLAIFIALFVNGYWVA